MQRVVLLFAACVLVELSALQGPTTQVGAPSRLIRRQPKTEGKGRQRVSQRLVVASSASLIQTMKEMSSAQQRVDPQAEEFLNGSFEDITKTTDSSGQESITNLMPADASGALTARAAVAGDAGNLGGWEFSGNVKLVAGEDATYGGLDAPEGGIFCSLEDHNAELSQEIEGHIFEAGSGGAAAKGGFYQLSFMAATKPKTAAQLAALGPLSPVTNMEVHLTGAKSRDISAGHRTATSGTAQDVDPDWSIQPLATFQGYSFIYEAEATKVKITIKSLAATVGSATATDPATCWSSRKEGKYVQEGHGNLPDDQCYDLATAKRLCQEASDCSAIATQSNFCSGKYRVTHGGPTYMTFPGWVQYNLWAYGLDRSCMSGSASSTADKVFVDDFSLRSCGETLAEAIATCGDDGETIPARSDCTQADGTFISGCTTYHKAVVSWPAAAWGAYSSTSHGALSRCLPGDATTSGEGFLFVSCCNSNGGVSRNCQKHKTQSEAAALCSSNGNRLCTEAEVMDGNTVGKGCSYDGPQNGSPSQMNLAWTSDACEAISNDHYP